MEYAAFTKIKTKAKAKSSSFGEGIQKDLGDEHGPMKRTILSHLLLLEKKLNIKVSNSKSPLFSLHYLTTFINMLQIHEI